MPYLEYMCVCVIPRPLFPLVSLPPTHLSLGKDNGLQLGPEGLQVWRGRFMLCSQGLGIFKNLVLSLVGKSSVSC